MKIKIDENLPILLRERLEALGHDADTVEDEGISGMADDVVWKSAQEEQRFLITQDLDFSDKRIFAPGRHHGIMLVRLMNPSRVKLLEKILLVFETENVDGWEQCLVVVNEHKIRIRKPA